MKSLHVEVVVLVSLVVTMTVTVIVIGFGCEFCCQGSTLSSRGPISGWLSIVIIILCLDLCLLIPRNLQVNHCQVNLPPAPKVICQESRQPLAQNRPFSRSRFVLVVVVVERRPTGILDQSGVEQIAPAPGKLHVVVGDGLGPWG